MFCSSLVEHIKLVFVGVVELSRAKFSWIEEKDTQKGMAKVCLDRTGVSGLPFCMFCTKYHVWLCFRASPNIFQLNRAKVSSLSCLFRALSGICFSI